MKSLVLWCFSLYFSGLRLDFQSQNWHNKINYVKYGKNQSESRVTAIIKFCVRGESIMKKKPTSLENREEIVVDGVKLIKPIITYEGSIVSGIVKGDEESLRENRKRIIKRMAEVYKEIQDEQK